MIRRFTSFLFATAEPHEGPHAIRRHGRKFAFLGIWIVLVGIYWLYIRYNNLSLQDSALQVANLLTRSSFGPLLYILIYALRPLVFFPASIVTILAGFLFGPANGIVYSVIGSNASAMLAYFVGRYFGRGVLEKTDGTGLVIRYARRMRQNSFETVLIMRLVLVPYDVVHYLAGFLRINWKAFLLATIIGGLPATVSLVLLGTTFGTLDELLQGRVSLNPSALLASVILIAASLLLSRHLKRRERLDG